MSADRQYDKQVQKVLRANIKRGKLKMCEGKSKGLFESWKKREVFCDNKHLIIRDVGKSELEFNLHDIKDVKLGDRKETFIIVVPSKLGPNFTKDSKVNSEMSFDNPTRDADDASNNSDEGAVAKSELVLKFKASDSSEWVAHLQRVRQMSQTPLVDTNSALKLGYYSSVQTVPRPELQKRKDSEGNAMAFTRKNSGLMRKRRSSRFRKKPKRKSGTLHLMFGISLISLITIGFGFTTFTVLASFLAMSKEFRAASRALAQSAWFDAVVMLLPRVEVFMSGRLPKAISSSGDTPKILIANHVSQLDMFSIWALTQRCLDERKGNIKFILDSDKDNIKLPFFSRLCLLFGFFEEVGDWKVDRANLVAYLTRYDKLKAPLWLVVFPEERICNELQLERNRKYNTNTTEPRPELKLCLLPKARRLETVLEVLTEAEIFDLTLQYDGFEGTLPSDEDDYSTAPTPKKLLNQLISNKVHVDIQQFSLQEVLNAPRGLQGWLDTRWLRKEKMVKRFIDAQSLSDKVDERFVLKGSYGKLAMMSFVLLMALTAVLSVTSVVTWIVRYVR